MMTEITIEVLTKFVGLIAALFTAYKLATKYFGANGRKIKLLEEKLAEAVRSYNQFEKKIIELEKKDELIQKDIKDLESDYKEIFKILLQRK